MRMCGLIPLLLTSVCSWICLAQSTPTAQTQKPSYGNDPSSVAIAISKVESGDFYLPDVEIIAKFHAVQAIPALERQFERSTDPETKGKIANALLRLGKQDGPYWDYLAAEANKVLADVPPTPMQFDADGKALPTPSKELTAWAKEHNLSDADAMREAIFDAPGVFMELGSSDDHRAIPILRRALAAKNAFIEATAARGLAELHDTESVPEIIRDCENAPKALAVAIALQLVYFDDPAAQQAVDKYLPAYQARELREERAKGKTPFR